MPRYLRLVPYVLLFPLSLSLVATATAQTPPDSQDTRPATPTTSGDTGFWTVPTGEVLPLKQWSASLSRLEANGGQGFLNMSTFPLTFAVGLGHRTEVFGSWHTVTRLDRDSRPLFFPASSAEGTGGGIDVDYPLTRTTFTGSKRGDLWLGAKLALLPARANRSLALAVRPMVKLPVGDKDAGTSSGKADFSTDVVVSTEAARFLELSGYGGMQLRGNPDGFALTHGIRWGVGAGLPSRLPLRMTVEVYGERYLDQSITAPTDFTATDGSLAPASTRLASPVYLNLGATLQLPGGFFVGVGGNWNLTMASRNDAGPAFNKHTFDAGDYLIRIGFHPGVRRAATSTATLTAAPAALPAPMPASPAIVAATVPPVAQSSAVVPAPVPVAANDGNPVAAPAPPIAVVMAPAVRADVLEDLYFDFDRSTLTPDAIRVLDGIAAAMRADPTLQLTIAGSTDDIGTTAYNVALGQRRAAAVQADLTARGLPAARITISSLGETAPRHANVREETRMMNRRVRLTMKATRPGVGP